MPCFRGIGLSIVAASSHCVFPEFPLPDGSSVHINGLQSSRYSSAVFLSPRRRQRNPDGRLAGSVPGNADPRISVYIPSAPDTNFYFRYVISQAPAVHQFLFFRVAINGRQAVSWGVDLTETLAGAAHQALFEPSAYYQHSDNGIIMTQYGIESRCFRFVTHRSGEASFTDDGGLIEVQVFRAKARARRAPQPDQYRGHDKYGVANGLLESPQMAKYYVYHLADPKDAPYVSFRFYYRSWANLRLLQLAPSEKPAFLCVRTTKEPLTTEREYHDDNGFDNSALSTCRDWKHTDMHGHESTKLQGHPSMISSEHVEAPMPPFAMKERPLPALPVNRKTPTISNYTPEETHGFFDTSAAINTNNVLVQRVRGVSEASKCSVPSNVSNAESLQKYAAGDGEAELSIDTEKLFSATRLEPVVHGKSLERSSPQKINRDQRRVTSSDDVFVGSRSSSSPEGDSVLTAKLSTSSPVKKSAKPRKIYVAPFTDSLCKRQVAAMPRSPTRGHVRGVSHDSSPKSRTSPKKRQYGASLDSQCQVPAHAGLVSESRGRARLD